MKKTKGRMWFFGTLLLLTIAFIWGNSCLPAEYSKAFSGWVRDLLAPLFNRSPDAPQGAGEGILRKIAHVTEFFALGLCAACLSCMQYRHNRKRILYPLALGFAVACVDEGIQCLVPGRGPGLKDVGIDTLGAALGIVTIQLILIIQYKKTNNTEEIKQ